MLRVVVRLEEWRSAERRRDALPPHSPAWDAADDEVRRAQAAYRAETSQAAAYYAELDFAAREHPFQRWQVRIDHTVPVNG